MLSRLKLTNYRSYRWLDIELSDQLVVVLGPNATGKTNLLESIFTLSTSKSFRSPDNELINRESDFYRIEATRAKDQIELSFSRLPSTKKAKQIKVNGINRKNTQLLGLHPVCLFEPNDLLLLLDGPDLRRRYLDIVLSQVDPRYTAHLSLYRHLLRQRNSLLLKNKRYSPVPDIVDQLFIYDLQMADPAVYIMKKRQSFVEQIAPILLAYYNEIAKTNVLLDLSYSKIQDSVDSYLSDVKASHQHDISLGHSSHGPHRGDLTVLFNAQPISHNASRGEVRTAVLALKLAEMDYVQTMVGRRPIFLLDDVYSELDKKRRQLLTSLLSKQQTLITTTDIDDISRKDYQLIDLSEVSGG